MIKRVTTVKEKVRNSSVGRLMQLCPQYDETQHSMYVELLEHAVYQDSLLNVALAGPYGSGKSSILSRFREKHLDKCISIGLSTLAPKNVDEVGQGSPQMEGTGGFGCAHDQEGLTNELEREIVRQLLYQGDPSKTPKSRFNRIHPMSKSRRTILSVLGSLMIMVVLILVVYCADNTTDKLSSWITLAINHLPTLAISFIFLAVGLSVVMYKLIIPKWHRMTIGGLSAMGATIKLEEGSFSYFDQYLDEILYFFEANNYDTVIFEDLDRFDNPLIFEQLRELNLLLNNADGIKKKEERKQIHFIYALRDSVFEPTSFEATGEYSSFESKGGAVPGSGRVKFFDQVIPLMPFLSDLSAYDHMKVIFKEELASVGDEDEREKFDRCLRTTAPLIADMRLIKAIRNEYLVLSDQMGPHTSRGTNLGLHESAILAMSIFKNIHPREFEEARVGDGWLNEVYEAYFSAVEVKVSALKEELAWCKSSELADKTLTERAAIFGDGLYRTISHIFTDSFTLEMMSSSYDGRTVKSPDFWNAFISISDDGEITVRENQSYYYRQHVTFTKSQLMLLMGIKSDDLALFKATSNSENRKKELQEGIDALLGADYPDVKGLTCPRDKGDSQPECTFEEVVLRDSPGILAAQLILNGFIGKDYRLYTSLFPDEGRASVINFITNHVNHNSMAIDFPLDEGDCAELVKRFGVDQYENVCTFNCDLLGYLVCNEQAFAKMMVRSACKHFYGEGKRFLETFIAERDEGCWLNDVVLGIMSAELDNIIPLIIDGVVPSEYRLKAMFFALEFLNEEKTYSVEGLSSWLGSKWGTLHLDEELMAPRAFHKALSVFEDSGFEAPILSNVDDLFVREIVERGLFVIARDNLKIATNGSSVLSLEYLFSLHRSVFARIVRNSAALNEYLSCLETGEFAFSSFEYEPFVICVSLAGSDETLLEKLIGLCSKDMVIDDVYDLAKELFDESVFSQGIRLLDLLVERGHIAPSSYNISCIMSVAKSAGGSSEVEHAVDALFANQAFEVKGELASGVGADELARAIILCNELNDEEAEKRIVALYDGYRDGLPFVASDIWPDSYWREELLVRLLEFGAVEVSVDAYRRLRNVGWELRERCLVALMCAGGSVGAADLFPSDVVHIMGSEKLRNTELRASVIDDPEGVLDACAATANDYADAAAALSRLSCTPPEGVLGSALNESSTWEHLEPWLPLEISLPYKIEAVALCASGLTGAQLEEALGKLGGQYAKICDRKTSFVKLPFTDSNHKIASSANDLLDIVSSISIKESQGIRINKHTSMLGS